MSVSHNFRSWVRPAGWSVADQTLFAAANFVLNVMLARWLPAHDYGAFSLAYVCFLLVGAIHTALYAEPMLVFGASRYRDQLGAYLRLVIDAHWRFAAISAMGFLAIGSILTVTAVVPLAGAFFVFSIALPCLLFQWLLRRACYVRLRPDLSAYAGILYATTMVGGLAFLRFTSNLTIGRAIMLLALASLLSAGLLLRRLPLDANAAHSGLSPNMIAKQHWRYGRWSIGAHGLGWIPSNAVYLVLPFSGGLETVAALRVLHNVLLPVQHLIAALSSLLVPVLARQENLPARRLLVRHLLAAFLGLAVPAWIVVGLAGEWLTVTLFGEAYGRFAHMLWFLGFVPVLAALQAVLGAALRAQERPDLLFWSYVTSSVTMLVVGIILILRFGIAGAIASLILAASASAFMMIMFYGRIAEGSPEARAGTGPTPRLPPLMRNTTAKGRTHG